MTTRYRLAQDDHKRLGEFIVEPSIDRTDDGCVVRFRSWVRRSDAVKRYEVSIGTNGIDEIWAEYIADLVGAID